MTAQETRKAPMSILVVGLGVIGTTYGYLFQKAGHRVEHLVRKSSARAAVSSLEVEILDGRTDPKARCPGTSTTFTTGDAPATTSSWSRCRRAGSPR